MALFAATLTLKADWKVYADKKVNQITGVRNTHARRVSTTLRHSGVEFSEYFDLSVVVC